MTRWGARLLGDGRARFRLWAPGTDAVSVEFAGAEPLAMTPHDNGWFAVDAPAAPGARYRFVLPGGMAVPDPASRAQAGGVHGWSLLVDSESYRWRTDWRGRPWHETVLIEVHAGVLGGFRGVRDRLPALAELGVTAVELMPVGAFGGTRNWGYDGVLPFAPAESYGTPDDLKALVDGAHALGMMIFLDVVYNHFGPDGNYLGAYAGDFFDAEVDTPWGGAVAVARPAVAAFFIENARMWIEEYRFDGLRFDAVHAIGDDGFLDSLAGELRAAVPDRHVHLVLENEGNDADRLAPDRFDAQWNDDFHNVLHVLLTGETAAYYSGFAEDPTENLARCLGEGFIYQGETPPGAEHARGKASGHLPATAFVAFLQNHDQIGNRAMGERLTSLADHDKLRAATALLLLCPQIPLLFMGDEDGSEGSFLFFTDFHDELADAVREGRRREFANFSAFADPAARETIPDPNARETFDHSRPEPGPAAGEWRTFYRELLALRHAHIIPRLKGARPLGARVIGTGAVEARWKMADGATLAIALNLGDGPVAFPVETGQTLFALGAPGAPASIVVERIP